MIQGRYKEALADCDAASKLAPKEARPHFIRGLIQYNFGFLRKARVDFKKALTRATYEPDYIRLYYCLTAQRLKQRDRAIAELKAYYEAKKDDPDPWYTQVVKFVCGDITEEAFLASAQAETPKKTSERQCEAYFYAGALREVAGQPQEARKLYLECARTGVRNFIEYETSRIALKRIPR
jgi:lipoprotein NlpI